MAAFPLISKFGPLPAPAFPQRAQEACARLRETGGERAAALADSPDLRPLLDALFGNSPFLAHAAILEAGFLHDLLSQTTPDGALEQILASLDFRASDLARTLRQAKRRVALLVAILDIGGVWPLDKVTGALSLFADNALEAGLSSLLTAAAERGELDLADAANPFRGSGITVIGMGKLGARELNYSSDIDIVVFFEPEKVAYRGKHSVQQMCIRITRDLVELLQERTADGYVFRTDLRLRPDPGATAVALSLEAAEIYYESMGQNWERAAMIKARPVAGDPETGAAFMQLIAPFVWRRNLDFAAIEDIHSIKRQIHAHKGHAPIAAAGHDVKLGRGGIREVEFFAQTQQLIAGGRDRRLREPKTCDAIRALAATGRIGEAVADEMIAAYEFLRRLEHRLQMVDDQQTQKLPTDPEELAHIAVFTGFAGIAAFETELVAVLNRVQKHYAALFESAPGLGSGGALVFTGTEDDPETLKTLAEMGFGDAAMVSGTIRRWHHGRYRAMRSARAREILTAIKPRLLRALAATGNPDHALLRFDEFLGRLPAGVQLLSMLAAQPQLLELVAEVLGTAPRLAAELAKRPQLFDAMVGSDALTPLAAADRLTADLAALIEQGRDFQYVLDSARRFAAEREFQVGVQLMRQLIDVDGAAAALTAIADAVLVNVLAATEKDFARQHGRVPGGSMAVVGMGKYGAREMAFRSDLDLIFVYEHPAGVDAADGKGALSPGAYFARLSQRVINALTALTPEGRLYEVDMRLRPSGNAGPVAVSIDGFERYHRDEAWTWERMALTRARAVAGPDALLARIERTRMAILSLPQDHQKLRNDVREMRARIAATRTSGKRWNLKYAAGGLVDAEFLAQYLVLRHGKAQPQIITGNTADAFDRLGQAEILPADTATDLARGTRLLRHLQMLLRLCVEAPDEADDFSAGLQALLASAGGMPAFSHVEDLLQETQDKIATLFREHVGTVAPA
jgi:glutamate-ammonia-ligase adenylyltransferase